MSFSTLESECKSDGVTAVVEEATFWIVLNARLAAKEVLDSVLSILNGSELTILAVLTIGA